jgi:hypothetical protein
MMVYLKGKQLYIILFSITIYFAFVLMLDINKTSYYIIANIKYIITLI